MRRRPRHEYRIGVRLAALAAAGLAASLPTGCGKKEENANVTSVTAPPAVQVTRPQTRRIVRVVGQPSFVESYERTSIYPKVTGYIEKWYVDIGDNVKKDQVLADLFVPEIREDYGTKGATVELATQQIDLAQATVKVAQADVKAAKSRLDAARAILDRYQALVDRWDSEVTRLSRETKAGVVDRQILDESKNQLRANVAARAAAEADIEKAQADLESAVAAEEKAEVDVRVAKAHLDVATSDWKRMKAWVGYLQLYAPFDGRIVARNANTGDFVMPVMGDPSADSRAPHMAPGGKSAPIYVVDRTDVVRIFVDVPEQDANYVGEGSKATVMIRAFRDRQIPATVTRTAWALNVKSRTLRAEIDLHNTDSPDVYRDRGSHQLDDQKPNPAPKSNPAGRILPGMYAYGKVIIDRDGVLAVPENALMRQGERTFVWLYEDGKALRTEIETGITDGEWVEVTSRHSGNADEDSDPWTPFDGTEQVILGDLSILTSGGAVHVSTEAPDKAATQKQPAAREP